MNASTSRSAIASAVGIDASVAPNRRRLSVARLVGIGHEDLGRAVGAGDLSHDDADRSGSGDEHAATRRPTPPCAARRCPPTAARTTPRHRRRPRRAPDGRRPRRSSRSRRARRHRWGARRTACAGTGCSRRSGLGAVRVGMLRLDGHPLSDPRSGRHRHRRRRSCPPLRGRAPRRIDDEAPESAVPVVVGVGAADPDRRHLDQHLTRLPACGTGRPPSRFGQVRPAPRPAFGRPAKVLCASHSPC